MHNATSDTNWSDSEIYSLLQARSNEALRIIGLKEAIDTTTSVASTQAYAYPTNAVVIRRVLYSGRDLVELSFRQWAQRKVTGTTPSGSPREFVLWNSNIYLIPVPSASGDTITIYSEKQQSAITSASSTIDVPEILHGALADGVIGMMFAKDLNAQMAAYFEGRWTNAHIPAMREFQVRKRRGYKAFIVGDVDSTLETELGST